jgi:hypothetical protein
MTCTEIGRIVPGDTYRRHQLRSVKRDGSTTVEDVDLGTYRVTGFAFEPVSRREAVVYVGLDGCDRGLLFVASPYDFAIKFKPLPAAAVNRPVADQLPARPAGNVTEGSGV